MRKAVMGAGMLTAAASRVNTGALRLTGIFVRWLIVGGISVLVLWAIGGNVILASVGPASGIFAARPGVPSWGSFIATSLSLIVGYWMLHRDVRGIPRSGGLGSNLRTRAIEKTVGAKGELTGGVVKLGAQTVGSALDILTPAWASMGTLIFVGWVTHTDHWYTAWPAALVLGALSGVLVGRRVGAVRHVRVTWRDVTEGGYVPLVAGLVGAIAGAYGWVKFAHWAGGVDAVALAGAMVISATAASVGAVSIGLMGQARKKGSLIGVAAAMAGTTTTVLETTQRWRVKRSRRGFGRDSVPTIELLPPLDRTVITHMEGVRNRTAEFGPEWEVKSASRHGLSWGACGPEEYARRELEANFEGLVVAIEDLPNTHPARPDAQRCTLAGNVGASAAGRFDALARKNSGARLVYWDPDSHTAIVAPLSAGVQKLRRAIAGALGCYEHDVELTATMADGHIDTVHIYRYPATKLTEEQRLTLWRDVIIPVIPGGNYAWTIKEPRHGEVLLGWHRKPELPKLVTLESLLPASVCEDEWYRIPLGVNAFGDVEYSNLALGPHEIVAGPTGSGKTVALFADVVGRLARGHQLVIIDPVKGVDFIEIEDRALAVAETFAEARRAIELVYEEVLRRKAVLKRLRVRKWNDLSPEVRRQQGIAPLTVLIDELSSLLLPVSIPKTADKEDDRVKADIRLNTHKAIIGMLIGKIAREARFVGVLLSLATQRPQVTMLGGGDGNGGELRSNLTTGIQLAKPGTPLSYDTLKMVFNDSETIEAAAAQFRHLDDKRSLGIAVIAADGGDVRAFRVAYQDVEEVPALLDRVGIPKVEQPWDLTFPDEGEVEGAIISGTAADGSSVFSVSLEDLEAFSREAEELIQSDDEEQEGDSESAAGGGEELFGDIPPVARRQRPTRRQRPAPTSPDDLFAALSDPSLDAKPAVDDDDFDFKM